MYIYIYITKYIICCLKLKKVNYIKFICSLAKCCLLIRDSEIF